MERKRGDLVPIGDPRRFPQAEVCATFQQLAALVWHRLQPVQEFFSS